MEASMEEKVQSPVAKANKARNAAVSELISKYRTDYDAMLAHHRTLAGLPASSGAKSAKEKALKHVEKLKDMGVDVSALMEQIDKSTW